MEGFKLDWRRLAKPQRDGYDTDAILWLIEHDRPTTYAPVLCRRNEIAAEGPRLGGHAVTVGIDGKILLPAPRFQPAADVPQVLFEAVELLGCWPEVAEQWPRILKTIQPYNDVNRHSLSPENAARIGSSSHNDRGRFGVIAVTVDDSVGTARAIVHEMAHHKLRAIGVDNESASRMVLNPRHELFFSPVGRPRPTDDGAAPRVVCGRTCAPS